MSDFDTLRAWVDEVCASLGIDPAEIPVEAILSMSKTVAHDVVRPGAPVTSFIAGYAAASGAMNPAGVCAAIDSKAKQYGASQS